MATIEQHFKNILQQHVAYNTHIKILFLVSQNF